MLFQFITDRVRLGSGYQYRRCLHFQPYLIKRSLEFTFSVAQIIFGHDNILKPLCDTSFCANNLYLRLIAGSNEPAGLLKQGLGQVILLFPHFQFFSGRIKTPVHTVNNSNNPYHFDFRPGVGYLPFILGDTNGVSISSIAGASKKRLTNRN
ncbi:hypothetical protein ES703_58658 [subsurface metagenome]